MRYISTRGGSPAVSLNTAMRRGLAPDGGLYMPETIPQLVTESSAAPASGPQALRGTALAVMAPYTSEIPSDELQALLDDALSFPMPLVGLEPGVFVLELFHGPTLAFKDIGARCMARLLARGMGGDDGLLTILVATSGDTGGAVAQAFHGVAGVRVAVLYPRGRVSELQELQFASLGGNVRAFAVAGSFDDCQRLVKAALAQGGPMQLSTANSINIGRLIPQCIFYAHALDQLPGDSGEVVCVTPSGNFGNLTSGLIAKRMGVPISRFIAATNTNDVVPEYLRTGTFEPRASVQHMSSAMDVGNPSNLERMRWLYDDDLDALRADVVAVAHDDDATRAAIRDVYARTGYVMDPHTAVGYLGWRALGPTLKRPGSAILLATAHPAKFRESIEQTLGITVELPEQLRALAGKLPQSIALQPALADLLVELETAWD